jgi:preprotein translocase subunit SecG
VFVGSGGRHLPLTRRRRCRVPHLRKRLNPVDVLRITLQVLLVLTSALLIPLVLLHKGKGGGLSDMFGGGVSSSIGSSGVAERNLNRITVIVAVLWTVVIVLLGLVQRVSN